MRLLLIGRGPWGQTIARTLGEMGVAFNHVGRDWQLAIENEGQQDRSFDGAIIATPASTHADIALKLLELKLPLFIEKPLALSVKDAQRIIVAADGIPLMVDHTDLYGHNFAKFAGALRCAPVHPRHVDIRFEGSRCHSDVAPVWDYGSHAVAIAVSLFGKALDVDCVVPENRSGADIHLIFERNDTASVHVRWGEDEKKRRSAIALGCTDVRCEYDGLQDDRKPHLTAALEDYVKIVSGKAISSAWRHGVDIAMETTRVLERCCSPTWTMQNRSLA